MSEVEEILSKLESKSRSYRAAFCMSLAALATLVVANAIRTVPDVIRTKSMSLLDGNVVVGVASVIDHKIVIGTLKGSNSLVSYGEGSTGAGTIVLSAASGKNVAVIGTVKSGGGSVRINGPDGSEVASISPNITNSGSIFIEDASGALVGEVNGDKKNGGAIVLHDAQGKETARVHQ